MVWRNEKEREELVEQFKKLYKKQMEKHMDYHVTEIECEEELEFYVKCRECNEKFESIYKVIEHENEGECNQCGKWLGCGTNMEKHKKREHEITSGEGNKEEENSSEDKESEVEIEEIQEVVGIMVHDLSDQSADYSSYDDKTRIESADNSSYDDKLRIESAVIVSYDDKSRNESTEELEKISTIEKQNINKTMSEVIRNRNTIYREDIEDLEKYIEEQVVDIIERQKIKEIIESLYDVVDDLGKLDTTEMQRVKKMVEVLYLTYEKSAEELEEINTTEKQKVKGSEILEMTDKDAELVNEKENDETINNNENIVAENLGTNEMAAPLGSVRLLRRAQKAVVQSNLQSDNELAAKDENGTNETAAPEMISKEVVQSNVPDKKKVIEQDKVDKIIE